MQEATQVERDGSELPHAYRTALARATVLSAEQERSLGEALVSARRARWSALLADPSARALARAHHPELSELPNGAPRARSASAEEIDLRLDHDPDGELCAALGRLLAEGLDELPVRSRRRAAQTLEDFEAAGRELERVEHRFVTHNLRLVVMMAHRFRRRGMPLVDLVQEGNIGLHRAVRRFDPRRGFRFSTYAAWWIRHCIARAIADHSRTVRVPVHVGDAARQLERARRELRAEAAPEQGEPELEQVARRAEIDLDKARLTGLLRQQVAPLDLRSGPEGRALHELLVDESAPDLEAELHQRRMGKLALGELRRLSPLEVEILEHRFGLGGREELTLQSLANRHGLSRERIRQIQNRALARLRDSLA